MPAYSGLLRRPSGKSSFLPQLQCLGVVSRWRYRTPSCSSKASSLCSYTAISADERLATSFKECTKGHEDNTSSAQAALGSNKNYKCRYLDAARMHVWDATRRSNGVASQTCPQASSKHLHLYFLLPPSAVFAELGMFSCPSIADPRRQKWVFNCRLNNSPSYSMGPP